jgi:hypothetical protein
LKVFRCGKEAGEGVVLSEIFPIVSQCDVTLFRVREPSVTTHALHYLVIFSSSTDPSSSPIISRFFAIPPTMTAQDVHYDAENDAVWVIASERGERNVNILRVPCYKTRLEASSPSSSPAKMVLLEDLFYDVSLQLGVAFFVDSGRYGKSFLSHQASSSFFLLLILFL